MSLRQRLLMVITLLLVTYVATAIVVVSTQRSLLEGQIDRRISALPPNAIPVSQTQAPVQDPQSLTGQPVAQPESPFSDLYIGTVNAEGATNDLLVGMLLNSKPDLLSAVEEANGAAHIVTVGSPGSSVRFRAAVFPQTGNGLTIVAALPLTQTDAAIDRLKRTLWIAGIVIASVLGTAFFWIQRHGLKPIAIVTSAAEAITAGDRSRRVHVSNPNTEAGKLGVAFNVMLDERDATETRLRQFVADASHELRTPLTSVRGYLELYRQGAFRQPEQLEDVVRRLSSETARMNGLVEDLLALATLDEGRPLRRERVDIGQLLRDQAQDAQASQPDRPISLDLPPSGPVATGDPALLIQLTGILVANALAHTPESASIILSARDSNDAVTIVVADKGPGLSVDDAAHVFDRFWRSEQGRSRTRKSGIGHTSGAGLGLAIARSIVERHGGSISLVTAPGEGCTFTISLPQQ